MSLGESFAEANKRPRLATRMEVYGDPVLRSRIFKMQADDQAARQKFISSRGLDKDRRVLPGYLISLDRSHQTELMSWIKGHGVPDSKDIGRDGVDAMIGLILHFPDAADQMRLLPWINMLFDRGEVTHLAFAMFYDKVMINNGHKQKYGTQVDIVEGQGGKAVKLSATVDMANLDTRRASMALPPEATYLGMLSKVYGVPVYGQKADMVPPPPK